MTIKTLNFFKNLFLKFGISIDSTTPSMDILGFLKKIRPVTTNVPLIRIGENGDGGYLVPDDLAGVSICFSPGVSTKASFEEGLSEFNIRSFLADYSVNAPPIEHPFFDFEKKFLGSVNNDIYVTLAKWIDDKVGQEQKDMILQMDIESSEYSVIIDTPQDILKRFRIIVVEFHQLDKLFSRFGFRTINTCFDKLLENFYIVHIHPNNICDTINFKEFSIPPNIEFTFLRKDRVTGQEHVKSLPHPLDFRNINEKKDIQLPNYIFSES